MDVLEIGTERLIGVALIGLRFASNIFRSVCPCAKILPHLLANPWTRKGGPSGAHLAQLAVVPIQPNV